MTNYEKIVTSCAGCGKYLTEKDKIYAAFSDGYYEPYCSEPYCSYQCVVRDFPWLKESAKAFFENEK